MPNVYTSKNVENGLTFDDLITKLLAYKPEQWGYTEQDFNNIKSDFNATENSLYNLPIGNYKLKNLPNSPFNSSFVNVTIYEKNGEKYAISDIGGTIAYESKLSSSGSPSWEDITGSQRDAVGGVIIKTGNTAPVDTSVIWVDTSKASTTGEIYLKYHNGTEWTSYKVNDSMDIKIYDKNNLKKDPYKAVMDAIEKFIGDYTEIIMHINNELKLIHVTAEEKEFFNTYLLTTENLDKYFAEGGEFYNELENYITSTISTVSGADTAEISKSVTETEDQFSEHKKNHITPTDISNWDSKANKDHTHIYDDNVTIDASDIVFGSDSKISDDQIPDDAKERVITISSLSVLKSGISTADLNSKYHNGNVLLYNDSSTEKTHLYKIVDNSYFNTANYMNGIKEFGITVTNANFSDAIEIPSSNYNFSDYDITDGLTTSQMNQLITIFNNNMNCEIVPSNLTADVIGDADVYVGIQKTLSSSGGGTSDYPMASDTSQLDVIVSVDSDKDLGSDINKFSFEYKVLKWTQGTLPVKGNWHALCYGKDKYISLSDDSNSTTFVYSTDGITWTQGALPVSRSWQNMCYGKDKFVALTSNIFIYSTDGITWTQGTLPVKGNWHALCYGKDKYISLSYNTSTFVYSTDGITWTQGALPVSGYWFALCYGKDKFVALSSGTSTFIYSTDGITWTQGALPVSGYWYSVYYGITWTQGALPVSGYWYSVYYGKDKFVALSSGTTTFIYSTDGITWTQGTLPTSGNWYALCYGKDKFVALELSNKSSTTFIYSTDGITWTQGTLPTSGNWYALCYGKDKFVALELSNKSSTTFIYSTDINKFLSADVNQYLVLDKTASDYFKTLYSYDSGNSNWSKHGLGRMIKVNKTSNRSIINTTYTINGFTIPINISWDTTKGLVFNSMGIVKTADSANTINSYYLTQTDADILGSKYQTIHDKINN